VVNLNGQVVADSAGELEGSSIQFEGSVVSEVTASRPGIAPYVAVQPAEGSPGSGLVLVAPSEFAPPFSPAWEVYGRLPYTLVLAVSEDTLASAWLDLLPEMGLAAAIALPVAILLAVLIARYITSPLEKLTAASHQMASGRFDVDVAVEREDEIGRLSRAFSTMAQRVGETQTQMRALVANVSHDMKTPLTSILGFSQALRDESGTETETRRMAAIINQEAERLNGRLNDLLYLAELESGQLLLQEEDVNIEGLLARAAARIAPDAERRAVSLTVDAAGMPALRTDAQKLERVLENLLDNARKFTPDRGRIDVRAHTQEGRVSIKVANTAEGIEPDELPRLFQRFYRRDNGGNAGRAGSGLGLPIARDLSELLGGRLEASLNDGKLVMRLDLPSTPG